jgi:hypothetical protein
MAFGRRTSGLCLGLTVAFPIWFVRYSKALYMWLDLWLDPPSEADFTVREPAIGPGEVTRELSGPPGPPRRLEPAARCGSDARAYAAGS